MARLLSDLSRDAYRVSRAAGDANALQRGGVPALVRRIGRRKYHSFLIKLARRGGIW